MIRHALRVAREHEFAEVSLHVGDLEFSAALQPAQRTVLAVVGAPSGEVPLGYTPVVAPVVGYFREASEPMVVGKRVEKGSVVGVVAALGLANEVEAPVSGEVVEILVEANQPVEFGQTIAMVRAGS